MIRIIRDDNPLILIAVPPDNIDKIAREFYQSDMDKGKKFLIIPDSYDVTIITSDSE